ncbi:MAG: dihydrofolate reductase family protein [Geodermatophilaceae bacterium]
MRQAVTVVGGVSVVQQLLHAGLVDELRVDVMPVLIGSGLRLFKNIDVESFQLGKVGVLEVGARTSLRLRVAR